MLTLACCISHTIISRARAAGFDPESWTQGEEIQQQTSELLLAFIESESREPHNAAFKVSGTPFRALQLGFLCLVQMADKFIPGDYSGMRNYNSMINWAQNYSAKDDMLNV